MTATQWLGVAITALNCPWFWLGTAVLEEVFRYLSLSTDTIATTLHYTTALTTTHYTTLPK